MLTNRPKPGTDISGWYFQQEGAGESGAGHKVNFLIFETALLFEEGQDFVPALLISILTPIDSRIIHFVDQDDQMPHSCAKRGKMS
jgi:hypothetical protein